MGSSEGRLTGATGRVDWTWERQTESPYHMFKITPRHGRLSAQIGTSALVMLATWIAVLRRSGLPDLGGVSGGVWLLP